MTQPMWKPIGEAASSLDANGLWIERIDGIRVPVRRHFGMEDLLDMKNRIQRNLLREVYRMNDERMGDRAYSEELRMRERRLEDEANARRARSQRDVRVPVSFASSLNPFMDFNW